MRSFELFNLPGDVTESELTGRVAVAVDILRAGTTIASALNAGATRIHPCVDVDQARERRDDLSNALQNQTPILGGERHGVLIPGFDLSNSPTDYQRSIVSGNPIVFTTTNGTLAIQACRPADSIVVGCFANLERVCQHVIRSGLSVSVVCAGTDGQPTMEDILFGGALFHRIQLRASSSDRWNATNLATNLAAKAAIQAWDLAERQLRTGKTLAQILGEAQGGKNLLQLNLAADVEFASGIDRYSDLPVVDRQSGAIVLAPATDVDQVGLHR